MKIIIIREKNILGLCLLMIHWVDMGQVWRIFLEKDPSFQSIRNSPVHMVSGFNDLMMFSKMQAAKHFMMKGLLNYFLTMI